VDPRLQAGGSEKQAKYQIYLYARVLSVRTGIPLHRFTLVYFDGKDLLRGPGRTSDQTASGVSPCGPLC